MVWWVFVKWMSGLEMLIAGALWTIKEVSLLRLQAVFIVVVLGRRLRVA
jgi:hypothetical protein